MQSKGGKMKVGIEAINAFCGHAYVDSSKLAAARGLDMSRFANLMMEKKSVGLPCDDAVTNAVNAAKPIIDSLSATEKKKIEMVITATESGLDFGKSLSTYVHKYLNLERDCRLFEIKQACYGGTAGLQMAANFIMSKASPGAKALVIATDCARPAAKMTYVEPSQGIAATAMLVSECPDILTLDFGANGYYGYEVFDTCRPEPDIETGNPDLSLLSYLDCLEGSFANYCQRVAGVNFIHNFDYLAFHTPFAGMVKGAHRHIMRKLLQLPPNLINEDFEKRVRPSLNYCAMVGNVYSATVYLALCSLIDSINLTNETKIGIFSYGSGCSSEFFSGRINKLSQSKLQQMQVGKSLKERHELSLADYDRLLELCMQWPFGVRNKQMDISEFATIFDAQLAGKGYLILSEIKEYERIYRWS
jgi:polyketide biosynthesis 3-hydroxy-3-methylglutaryl-CoA synthase-like enzyme PksG